jgi:hypothetical protein
MQPSSSRLLTATFAALLISGVAFAQAGPQAGSGQSGQSGSGQSGSQTQTQDPNAQDPNINTPSQQQPAPPPGAAATEY